MKLTSTQQDGYKQKLKGFTHFSSSIVFCSAEISASAESCSVDRPLVGPAEFCKMINVQRLPHNAPDTQGQTCQENLLTRLTGRGINGIPRESDEKKSNWFRAALIKDIRLDWIERNQR